MRKRLTVNGYPYSDPVHVECVAPVVCENEMVAVGGHGDRCCRSTIRTSSETNGEGSDHRREHDGDGDQQHDPDDRGDAAPGHTLGWPGVRISTFGCHAGERRRIAPSGGVAGRCGGSTG